MCHHALYTTHVKCRKRCSQDEEEDVEQEGNDSDAVEDEQPTVKRRNKPKFMF